MSLKSVHSMSLKYSLNLSDRYLIESSLLSIHIKDAESFFDVKARSLHELLFHVKYMVFNFNECQE